MMKLFLTSLFAVALACISSTTRAQELEPASDGKIAPWEGVWNATAKSSAGGKSYKWTIKKVGDSYSVVSLDLDSSTETKVDRVKTEKDKLTAEIDFDQDGSKGILKVEVTQRKYGEFEGKWDAKDAEGTSLLNGEISGKKEINIDLAGNWASEAATPEGGTLKAVLVLTKSSEKLTGKFSSESSDRPIDEVKFDGKKDLRMAFKMENDGTSYNIVIEAELDGPDTLKGMWIAKGADGSDAAKGDWKAKRKNAHTGAWAMTVDVPDSESVKADLHLEESAGSYSGKVVTSGNEKKLNSVKVDGNDIVVSLDWTAEGTSGVVTLKGTNKDGKIEGTWAFADSSEEHASGKWTAAKK